MKSFYSRLRKPLFLICLFITLNSSVKAQTALGLGDIIFTGYNSDNPDQFSFVLLKAVTAGTVINFTDNGWYGPTGTFGSTEGVISFTSIALPAGREIFIRVALLTAVQAGNATSAGTVAVVSGSVAFSTTGDQIFAYQGTLAVPTLITALQMNVGNIVPDANCANSTVADWDGVCTISGSNPTWKPASFNGAGSSAVWIGLPGDVTTEKDNAKFVNTLGMPLGTIAQVIAAVTNQANWLPDDVTPVTLPTNFAYLGLFPLPINLVSFTGKLNPDKTVSLQWKVSDQQDAQGFTVEESADGSIYRTLGTVAPNAGDTYSLVDAQVATGKNYYRLKTTDLAGKTTYSNVVVINMKAGTTVLLYPNPVTDVLTIQQFSTVQNKTAVLSDGQGKILQQVKLTSLQQPVNMERYPAGVYILKLEDGTVFKVMKQ
jgi:hypothetical protein